MPVVRPVAAGMRAAAPFVHRLPLLTVGGLRMAQRLGRRGSAPAVGWPVFRPAPLLPRLAGLIGDPVRPCAASPAPVTVTVLPAVPGFAADCLSTAAAGRPPGTDGTTLVPAHDKHALFGRAFTPIDLGP